jgi:hypothetical protein
LICPDKEDFFPLFGHFFRSFYGICSSFSHYAPFFSVFAPLFRTYASFFSVFAPLFRTYASFFSVFALDLRYMLLLHIPVTLEKGMLIPF